MNDAAALERRYRRLLAWFPSDHRHEYGEEMIGVLLASTPEGRSRPESGDAANLIAGGLRARLRALGTGLSDAHWPDALAVCSAALPAALLVALASIFVYWIVRGGWDPGLADFFVPSLALALPPMIALRYRRTAAFVALAAAAWSWFMLLRLVTVWIDGLFASYCVALLVQVIALGSSPGPRRAVAIMTWKTWLVVCAAGVTIGLASIWYPWHLLTWQAAALAAVFIAAVGAGLVLSLARPVALRLLLLIAVPAVPAAVWVLQFASAMAGSAVQDPFPVLSFVPLLALALASAATVWRARRGSKTA